MKHLRYIPLSIILLSSLSLSELSGQQRQFIFERVQGVYMQPTSNAMDVDEYGRLWYGTWGRGLFEYDGYAFTRYQNTPNDSNSLVNDRILDLEADSHHRVWVSTMNGLDCIDRKTGQVRHFQALGDSIFQFMAVYEDKTGQVWTSGARGTLRFQEKTKLFENIPGTIKNAPTARPNAFFEDAAGTLWLGRGDGLLRFAPDRNSYEYIPIYQGQPGSDPFRVQTILEDRNANLWIAGYDGLFYFDRVTGQTIRPKLPDSLAYGRFSALLQDASGAIWMTVPEKGLYQWTPETGSLRQFVHNEFDPTSLPSNNVFSLLYDSFGNLWMGTDRGLARLNLLPQSFSRWLLEPSNPELIRNNIIRIAQDQQGGILVRTQKEMFYLEQFGSVPIPLLAGINRPKIFEPDDFIKDQDGNIWAIYDGIFRWNPGLRQFFRIPTPLKTDRVLSMAQDQEDVNVWWLGTLTGLHRFDLRSGEMRLFKDLCPAGQARGIGKILDDGRGNLWLSAPATLACFDKKKEKTTFYSSKTPPPHQLISDDVLDLQKSPEGAIWVTTTSGITRIDPSTGEFQNLNQKDGLPDNLALTVLLDHNRNPWFVFPEHVLRRDEQTGAMQVWNTAAMLQTGQLARGGGCTLSNGRLLIAARSGLILVDPTQMDETRPPSSILLTRFETSEKGKKRTLSPEFLKHIQLANSENNITLEWAGIQTARADELRYECKLERKGEHLDWEQKEKARQAVYANLEPGAYTFRVRIAGCESPEFMLEIAIAPAWWQAESFKMLLMALFATAAYLFWRNRENHRELLQQKELAEQNAHYKTRFLANMSHEIRTPMNAILGLSRLLTESKLPPKQGEYADAIRQSSENLLVIVNDVLDQMKIESGQFKFQHKPFDLALIVRHLKNTLGFKAEEKGLRFDISIAPEVPTRLIGDPVRLNQILTNLLGNAIKFTDSGRVELAVAVGSGSSSWQSAVGSSSGSGQSAVGSSSGSSSISSSSSGQSAGGSADRLLPLPTATATATLIFTVSDSGIGIPSEQISRVFESFQQADDDISANYGGTGLGLSITKDLVEQQGGHIDLESEVGRGTTISATLIFELDHISMAEAEQGAQQKIAFKNLRVLLVEDTFFNQMLAVELLKSRIPGVEIAVAENGQIALEKIETDAPFDLVLMDVKMPVMDGLEATRRLRAIPKWHKLPIIALTANAVQEELDKCRAVGMDAYVTKPIDTDELFTTMFKVLNDKSL